MSQLVEVGSNWGGRVHCGDLGTHDGSGDMRTTRAHEARCGFGWVDFVKSGYESSRSLTNLMWCNCEDCYIRTHGISQILNTERNLKHGR